MKKLMKGFTLVELMIVVAIIGILAAIAIPNFMKFQARAKQSEAKTNLKSVYTAEKSYYAEKDTYSSDFSAIGATPERGNRYAYYLQASPGWQIRTGSVASGANFTGIQVDTYKFSTASAQPALADNTKTPGVSVGSDGNFVVGAAGTVDNDSVMDTWYISDQPIEKGQSGTNDAISVGGGTPANTTNDVMAD